MLSDKRIEEAEKNVRSYIEEGLLKKFEFDKNIFEVFMSKGKESLNELERVKSPLWKVVISYYSMYYYANAILIKMNYKVGDKISHKVTSDALIVFLGNKLKKEYLSMYEKQTVLNMKSDEVVYFLDKERIKRNKFQYEMSDEIKNSRAETSIKRAKEFAFAITELIEDL